MTRLRSQDRGNLAKVPHDYTFSGYRVSVEPVCLPVTLAEVKRELRLSDTSLDGQIEGMIHAAVACAETKTGFDFIPRTYVQYLDCWPAYDIYAIRPRLLSVSSIKYLDSTGTQQTLAADQYVVDTNHVPGRISRAYGVSWPTLRGQNAQVEITLECGHKEKTGALAGAVSAGAKTSILVDTFDNVPGRTGVLYLTNASGENETVAYTNYRVNAGQYEFYVNDTLAYSYENDSVVEAHNIPLVWRKGIIGLVVDMFEHPEASTEILLYKNKTIQNLLNTNAIQEF